MEKFKDRKFCLLLYPEEDNTHTKALEIIKENYDHAYIIHDQDLDKDDEFKKAHCHVVISIQGSAKWNTALAKDLGITENYIQKCRDLNKALKYLIHFDEPDKYQYNFEDVQGCKRLKDKLWALIVKADKSQEELSDEILDYIDNYGGIIKYKDFIRWINGNGLISTLKSLSGWYRDIIIEHNNNENKKNRNSYVEYRIFKNGKEISEEERIELFK